MKSVTNILLACLCVFLAFTIINNTNNKETVFIKPTYKDIVNQNQNPFDEIKQQALKENKNIMVLFGASWCVPCQKMEHDTLFSMRSKNALESQNLLFIKIDVEKNQKISDNYNIKSLPTSIIIDGSGKEIKRKSGFMNVRDFVNWITSQIHN